MTTLQKFAEKLRPKKLHLLVLRRFVGPFLASFSVALFILVLQVVAQRQNDIFGKGLGADVIGQLFLYISITLVVMALAMGVLLSSLMCFGNMGESYELAALKSAGIHPLRITYPLLIGGLLITLFAYWISFYVQPWANLKMYSLLYDVQNTKPTFALKPGVFNTLVDGYAIRMTSRGKDDMMYDVMLYDHSDNRGAMKVTMADSGRMWMDNDNFYLRMKLYHGTSYEDIVPEASKPYNYPFSRANFDTLNYKMDLSGMGMKRTNENLFANHQYMLNVFQLIERLDSLKKRPNDARKSSMEYIAKVLHFQARINDSARTRLAAQFTKPILLEQAAGIKPEQRLAALYSAVGNARTVKNYTAFSIDQAKNYREDVLKYDVELHEKLSKPLAVIVLLLIGAPLGSIIRKGGLGMPVVIGVIFFIMLYLLNIQGKKLAREEVVPMWLGMWLPILVMSPIAAYLNWQSSRDSRLFEAGTWNTLFTDIWSALVRIVTRTRKGETGVNA